MNSIIRDNIKMIGDFLNGRCDVEDPAGVLLRLNEAAALLGTAAYNIAETEKIYVTKLGILAEEYKTYSPTTAKNILAGKLSEEGYYKTLAETQDKQLHYVIETLRTTVSYLKNEMSSVR